MTNIIINVITNYPTTNMFSLNVTSKCQNRKIAVVLLLAKLGATSV